jgi:hypothetical protein
MTFDCHSLLEVRVFMDIGSVWERDSNCVSLNFIFFIKNYIFFIFLNRFNVLISKIILKNIILMYF